MKKLLRIFLLFIFILFSCSERKLDNSSADIFEFDIDSNRLIVVPAKIGNVKCNLMIDTGSTTSVLSEEFATRIDSSFRCPTFVFDGMNGIKIKSMYKAKQNLQIGDFNFSQIEFIKAGLDDFFIKNIDGLIGTDVLKKSILKLDYSNKKGYFIPFSQFKNSKELEEYEKIGINKHSCIEIQNRNQNYNMLIDSGAESMGIDIDDSIIISDAEKLKPLKVHHEYIFSSYNFEGTICKSKTGFKINTLNIQPIAYTSYPFKNSLFNTKVELSGGIKFISKLNWIFDYANNYVYISKSADFNMLDCLQDYEVKDVFFYPKVYALQLIWKNNKNPIKKHFDIKSYDKIFGINGTTYKECVEKFGNDKAYKIFGDTIQSLDFDTITVIRNGKKLLLNRR